MNNDEAKFLLTAYRPNGADAGDPAMAAALAQARADPTLGEWFALQQRHDTEVAAKLRSVAPPAGLREAILAGARASGRPTRRPWRHPAWLAAAAVAVLLTAGALWRWLPVRGASFDDFAINFVARGFILQKHGSDLNELRNWLAERRGPLPSALPPEFARLRALGCRTLSFRDRDISLVCFERGGKEYHVFVARREDLPDVAPSGAPRLMERDRLVAAAWSDARNHYVVVSDADLAAFKRVL